MKTLTLIETKNHGNHKRCNPNQHKPHATIKTLSPIERKKSTMNEQQERNQPFFSFFWCNLLANRGFTNTQIDNVFPRINVAKKTPKVQEQHVEQILTTQPIKNNKSPVVTTGHHGRIGSG